MKNYTPYLFLPKIRYILLFLLLNAFVSSEAQMYGDTIFWENFGTGSVRSDITGLGKIGGMYKYEGLINYVYALNSAKLEAYKASYPAKNYITEDVTFHEMPLLTTEDPYSYKPTVDGPGWASVYFNISSWRNRTISAAISDSPETLDEWDDTASSEDQIPAAWTWIDGEWKFGFYYITYENTSHCTVPDDGHYAIVSNLDLFDCGSEVSWLPDDYRDHTGYINNTASPITTDSARVATDDDSRMLFINCAAVTGISSPVYKRLVTELCRDSWFEFSIWYASVQTSVNNAQFRLEFWSADPGNDPSLGDLTSNDEGDTITKANEAILLKVGETTDLGVSDDLGKWFQIKEYFLLSGQDYVWVVVRNYGQGGSGNDIALDDIVFKPWAPFTLNVEISANSLADACSEGVVTMLSDFPSAEDMPGYVDIQEYSFYFEGLDSDGNWVQLGSEYPLQTQSVNMPLELTLTLSEYGKYSQFRIAVSSTAYGFGGKCVTFTQSPTDNVAVPSTPTVVLSGEDVCDDTSGTQQGYFILKNVNQEDCEGWSVKVKMPDGTYETFLPETKASCE